MHHFYEFFSGGGMVRAGLGDGWKCVFANDFDHKKSRTYERNWGAAALMVGDVRDVTPSDLPGAADLAWASFPCQDLSLAGGGAGLSGDRSGTFWPFWRLVEDLVSEGRAPTIVTLENVVGTLTSHEGKDFATICQAFRGAGYRCGAVVMDAVYFVPQSRARLFIVAVREDAVLPDEVRGQPDEIWHPATLHRAFRRLPKVDQDRWIWWNLPAPTPCSTRFADLVEEDPGSVEWHSAEDTRALLNMMNARHLGKVEDAKKMGRRMVGTVYKRTRRDKHGRKVQRAEIRFDNVAGCLRTPAGGSSRQLLVVVDGQTVRSRLISTRETARLMGLRDSYILPEGYNEAYHLTGDGVVVPVVRYLSEHVLEPIIETGTAEKELVAA